MKTFLPTFFAFIILVSFCGCKKDNGNSLKIGQYHQGGIIFYLDESGEHGLIAAPEDPYGRPWSNGVDSIRTKATGTAVGTGMANTMEILAAYGAGDYAARVCERFVLDGYYDWFLPSKDELNLLYEQKDKVGGFTRDRYWSSTDLFGFPSSQDNRFALSQDFRDGNTWVTDHPKNYSQGIRPIRAF